MVQSKLISMRVQSQIVTVAIILFGAIFVPSFARAAVQFIGAASGTDTITTMPPHQAGDMIVVYSFWAYNANPGNLPAGWTEITMSQGQAHSARLAFRIAQSSSETSGTWTTADSVVLHVYRGQDPAYATGVIPNVSAPSVGNSATVVFPGLTMRRGDGTSIVVGFVGQRGVTTIQNPPAGMVNRIYRTQTTGNTNSIAGHDTNTPVFTSTWPQTSVNTGVAGRYRAHTLEIDVGTVVQPSITSVAAIGTNAGREYSASDTDGLIQLIGTNFGSSAGTIVFSGAWGSATATVHSIAEGSCTVGGWTTTSVCVEVPAIISDSAYTATITLTRADSAFATAPTFSILPRVTNMTPNSAIVGDIITITGNHFCQGGVCPTVLDSMNTVMFGSVPAVTLVSWSDTEVKVLVPSGTTTGTVSLLNSGTTTSVGTLTILSTVPNNPNLGPSATTGQFTADGFPVAIGGAASTTVVNFRANMSAGLVASLRLEVEVKTRALVFDGNNLVNSPIVSYGGSGTVIGSATTTLVEGESYHWRARVRNTTTNEVSSWVAFGGNPTGDGSGDGSPANTDFIVSATGPVLSGVGTAPNCSSHDLINDTSARVFWSVSSPLSPIINKVLIATSSDMTGAIVYNASSGLSPQISITGLTAETAYYYQVVSEDSIGVQASAPISQPFCTFITEASAKRINKLSEFYICQARDQNENWSGGAGVVCAPGQSGARLFNVFVSEMSATNPVVQTSAFVEVFGIADAVGDFSVTVDINGEGPRTTTIRNPAGSVPFRILYPLGNGYNLDYPADTVAENILDVAVSGATSVSSMGAKAILNYYYFPTY